MYSGVFGVNIQFLSFMQKCVQCAAFVYKGGKYKIATIVKFIVRAFSVNKLFYKI